MTKPILRNFDEYVVENAKNKKITTFDKIMNYLDGHCDKTFVLCQSGFFKDFCDEIKNNPEASYVTYLNNFIKENYDGENIHLEEFSCFKKESAACLLEEIMAKLANAMHLPTAYIKSVVISDDEAEELFNNNIPIPNDYTLSIDFISKKERFDSINDYNISTPKGHFCPIQSPLREWYKCFLAYYLKNPITDEILRNDQNMGLFRQFIPQYFFRKYVARDWDFKSENVGVIYDKKTKTYRISPLFDFEFSYFQNKDRINEEELEEDLDLAYAICEKETESFVQEILNLHVNKFVDENIFEDVVANIVDDDGPTTKEFIRSSLHELRALVSEYVFSKQNTRLNKVD